MFHHLIYFKLLQKKITNPEESNESSNSSKTQNKGKFNSHCEEYLLIRKISEFVKSVENLSFDLNKTNKNGRKFVHKSYHEKMKLKLEEKKKEKLKET